MTATDLVYYNATSDRGGAIDLSSPITTGQLNNLLPNVNAIEAEAGIVKYRKFFVKNTHATDTALALSTVMTRFSSADDYMAIFSGTASDEIGDTTQSIGTGDDSTTTFSDTLSTTPVLPHSVSVTADTVVGYDDGNGVISGTGIASGSVDYSTGAVSVTFDTAPANAVDVSVAYRDTADKMFGVCYAENELDRGTKTVTVSLEGSQTLSDLFADGDTIHFLDNSTGQKIAKATIATSGVDDVTPALTIVEDIPSGTVLLNSFIANTIYTGDLNAGSSFAVWVRQTVPAYCQAYTNSYFGVNSIFATS